jgi:hypothetical protein
MSKIQKVDDDYFKEDAKQLYRALDYADNYDNAIQLIHTLLVSIYYEGQQNILNSNGLEGLFNTPNHWEGSNE